MASTCLRSCCCLECHFGIAENPYWHVSACPCLQPVMSLQNSAGNLKPFPPEHASASKHLVVVVLVPLVPFTSEAAGDYTPFMYKPSSRGGRLSSVPVELSHVVTCCHSCPFSSFNLDPRSAERDSEAEVAAMVRGQSVGHQESSGSEFLTFISSVSNISVELGGILPCRAAHKGSESKPGNPCLLECTTASS